MGFCPPGWTPQDKERAFRYEEWPREGWGGQEGYAGPSQQSALQDEGLKAKVDNSNDMFGHMELTYKAFEQEHEAKKQEAFDFKFKLIQVRKDLSTSKSLLEAA